jgi:ATP-dependent RNA helicase SrmB
MSFEPFNFNENLLEAIEQAQFTKASKIQQLVIPEVLEGKDILASAHSGSGKSASFVLPLIQRLLNSPRQTNSSEASEEESESKAGARVLILTPTRELANQVSACIRRFTKEMELRYGILVGGAPYPPQVRMLKKPIDFLVATPGRLLDHIKNDRVNFSDIEYLVIDELNRMLDMGMTSDVEEIISHLPSIEEGASRQTLIFSGSLEGEELKNFSEKYQNNAQHFELVKSKQSYRSLQQSTYISDEGDHKFKLCKALVETADTKHIAIFGSSDEHLGEAIDFIEAQLSGSQRNSSKLELPDSGKTIFFLNDESSQRDDLENTENLKIIHLDLPDDVLIFLQRLEIATEQKSEQELCLLIGKNEWPMLHQIERYIGKTLSRKKIEGLEPESTEPKVSSKLSGSRNNAQNKNAQNKNTQSKNRNPYSGRRQNAQGGSKKPKNKNASNGSNGGGQNKNHKQKKGKQNKQNRPQGQGQGQQGQQGQNGNQVYNDPFMDDRDLSWKQYISNISSGKGGNTGSGNKNANRKYRKRQSGQNSNFDINNSPMAISAKSLKDMNNSNDEWIEQEDKKPDVQIRVKGQGKTRNSQDSSDKSLNDADGNRIGGKLGINK